MQQEAPQVNLILIGEPSVGKSSLFLSWKNPADNFAEFYLPTISHDFSQQPYEASGKQYELHIYDASGLENYIYMYKPHLEKADGVIVMFDVTNKESFTKALKWIQLAKETAKGDTEYLLVGSKTDLEAERQMKHEEAAEFAKTHGLNYVEISTKNKTNLKAVQDDLVPRAIKVHEKRASEGAIA